MNTLAYLDNSKATKKIFFIRLASDCLSFSFEHIRFQNFSNYSKLADQNCYFGILLSSLKFYLFIAQVK